MLSTSIKNDSYGKYKLLVGFIMKVYWAITQISNTSPPCNLGCFLLRDKINGLAEKMNQKSSTDKVAACMKIGGEEVLLINDKIYDISLYCWTTWLYRLFRSCKMTRRLRSISFPHRTCYNLVKTIKIIVLSLGCGMNGKRE